MAYISLMLKKKYSWHIAIWIVYLSYQFLEHGSDSDWDMVTFALISSYVVIAISTFYLFYLIIWKRFLKKPHVLSLTIAIIFGLLFFICFRFLIEEVVYESIFGFGNYINDDLKPYFFDNIWRALFYAIFSLVVFLLEREQDMEKKVLALKTENVEAEMAFLRSQLNPHFLFNTLSFLHAKTIKFDPELSDTIRKLSDMLRYSLQSSKEAQVSLQKEVELIENYIDIFRNRFEGRFFVEFDMKITNLGFKIEPLLLIPFVENMFKHGVMSNSKNPGIITLNCQENTLVFKCQNQINTYKKDASSGIGLENVRRRLELLYPDCYTLNITEDKGYFTTDLQLSNS